MGPIATVLFTVMRGDVEQTMNGQPVTKWKATVAIRATMPLSTLAQLREVLNKVVLDGPPSLGNIVAGSNLKQ